MAQFDVHLAPDEATLVVDCQSDLLDDLPTRVVIPLYRPERTEWQFSRLTPKIIFGGVHYILATPVLATVDAGELSPPRGSLADERYTILNALDFLLTGN